MIHTSLQGLSERDAAELEQRLRQVTERLEGVEVQPSELFAASLEVARRRQLEAPRTPLLDLVPAFLDDFCLALACRQTPPCDRAWAIAIQRCSPELVAMARPWAKGSAEEVVTAFFGDLWLRGAADRSPLETYMGRAPLHSWMALVLRRRMAREHRRQRTTVPVPEGLVEPGEGPQAQVERSDFLTVIRPMLDQTLANLSSRDRDLVEARVLRRERGVDTAQRIGVSQAYVSRRFREVTLELRLRLGPWLTNRGFTPEKKR